MTLREAIDKGLFELDEEVTALWWDDHNPDCSMEDPDDYADACELPDGSTFQLSAGLQCAKRRTYKVVFKDCDENGKPIHVEAIPVPDDQAG